LSEPTSSYDAHLWQIELDQSSCARSSFTLQLS
jgi:hypothetical protein